MPKNQSIATSSNKTQALPDSTAIPFYARSAQETLQALKVEDQQGLTRQAARERRKRYGRNRLQEAKRRSVWKILIDQFKSVVLLVLAVAAAIAFSFGEWIDGLAIVAVLVVNGVIGLVSEWRATRSMEVVVGWVGGDNPTFRWLLGIGGYDL